MTKHRDEHLYPQGTPASAVDFENGADLRLVPTEYPYSRVALDACSKCRRFFGHPRFEDVDHVDQIVEHHARHRLGICCTGPGEDAA